MEPGGPIKVYLEHDTDDQEFINVIHQNLNALGIFNVFVSTFDEIETVSPEMQGELEQCDIFVVVCTRRSLRADTIEKEIDIVEKENKVVVAFYDDSSKIRRMGKLSSYKIYTLTARRADIVLEHILSSASLYQEKLRLSQEQVSRANARLRLIRKPKDISSKHTLRRARQILFRRIVSETLGKLGYSVTEKKDLKQEMRFFDMSASKGKSTVWVKCWLGMMGKKDISQSKRLAGADEVWAVTTGATPRANLVTAGRPVRILDPYVLIGQLDTEPREKMTKKLKPLLSGKMPTLEPKEVEVKRLITMPEGQNMEFKATLRYDLSRKTVNPILEKASPKTICAFMNANGGLLVIGVTNDRIVSGLSHDYKTVKRQNSDGFENHITNLIGSRIGNQFLRFTEVSFSALNGKEICTVKVLPSDSPVFLKDDGEEEFYVRTGNNSRPFTMTEALAYIKQHWNSAHYPVSRTSKSSGY